MDLKSYVGKEVEISLYRKHNFRIFRGRLTDIQGSYIRLFTMEGERWISRPHMKKDSIKEVKE